MTPRLIACDVDGTLLPAGQPELSDETVALIRRIVEAGIVFVPASGRQLTGLRKVFAPVGCVDAFVAEDGRGRLFALGFATLVFAHVYINLAMSIGLVPITGLPLPFVSSGRTFLVVVMCGLGLVQSVSIHRRAERRRTFAGD